MSNYIGGGEMIDRNEIGAFIRRLREEKKMSVLDLANASGLPRNTIYRVEEGGNYPRIDTLDILLRALGCELTLGGKGTMKWFQDVLKEEKRARGFEEVNFCPFLIKLPTRKTKGSGCYDFYLPKDVTIKAHSYSEIILTYVKAIMPEDEALLLFIRSSIGIKKHVMLANNVAVIDSDYANNLENDGNIGLVLYNNSNEDVTFEAGERIVQGMFVKYQVTDDDKSTEERKGGYGSTGK